MEDIWLIKFVALFHTKNLKLLPANLILFGNIDKTFLCSKDTNKPHILYAAYKNAIKTIFSGLQINAVKRALPRQFGSVSVLSKERDRI